MTTNETRRPMHIRDFALLILKPALDRLAEELRAEQTKAP